MPMPWSAILKKIRDCAERSEVRESWTVKLEPARARQSSRSEALAKRIAALGTRMVRMYLCGYVACSARAPAQHC